MNSTSDSDMRLLAAEGIREITAVLSGDQHSVEVRRRASATQPESVLRLSRTPPSRTAEVPSAVVPDADVLQRYLFDYVPDPGTTVTECVDFAPAHTLVVLAGGILAESLPLGQDTGLLRVHDGAWTLNGREVGTGQAELRSALTALDFRHVRIVVDLGDPELWLTTAPEEILRVHDAMLVAAQATTEALASGGTFQVLALRGADSDGVAHPYAGLFTGFVKTLEVEPASAAAADRPGVGCVVLLTSATEVAVAVDLLRRETSLDRVLPVAMYAGHERRVLSLRPSPLEPATTLPLTGSSVVVGAGAGRGIGMAMLRGLAHRCGPEIHVLGSNDLSSYDPESLTEPTERFRERRRAHLRAGATATGRQTVAELNRQMKRLAQAREVHAELQVLRGLCGQDRVHYHVCDLSDPAAVQAAARAVLDSAGGTVDLLLNVAGLFGPAELATAELPGFQSTRNLKVNAYRNLKSAFDGQVRQWVNTSSVAGVFGLRGEAAYSSANDFLLTAGAHAHRRAGVWETSIGWGLWGETGMATDAKMAGALVSNREFTPMPIAEGQRHLFNELALTPAASNPVFVGQAERQAMSRYRPDVAALWSDGHRDFFLDEPVEATARRLVAYRDFTDERDGYLADHLIDGHPTLPGLMYLEIGAQAACRLVPDRTPVAAEDLVLERFLRLYGDGRPQRKKIVAELLRHDPSPTGESEVRVTVTADYFAPSGQLLAKDRRHAEVRILLRDRPRSPSRLPDTGHREGGHEVRIRNPYRIGGPFAQLSGVFAAASHVGVGPDANRAAMRLDADRMATWFRHSRTPAILCDAAAQISIAQEADGWSPVAVPLRVGRVDFYDGATDSTVATARAEVTLLATSPLLSGRRVAVSWAAVVGPDGLLVARMSELTAEVIGYIHQDTGEFRPAPREAASGQDLPQPASAADLPEDQPAVRPHLVCYSPSDYARPVRRLAVSVEPAPPLADGPAYLTGKTVLLIGAHTQLLEKVGHLLTVAGASVLAAASPSQVQEIAATANTWDGIIDLNLTGLPDYTLTDPAWQHTLDTTTEALHLVYPAWLAETAFHRRFYLAVTARGGTIGRHGDALPQPLSGMWSGLTKTLPMELPTLAAKVIDLDADDPDTVATAVLTESGHWDHQEVGYRDHKRYWFPLRHHPLPPAPGDSQPIGAEDCVLISGGGRGIGWQLAMALAATGAHVVVTGRQALPAPDDEVPPPLTMGPAEFAVWRTGRLQQATAGPGGLDAALNDVRQTENTRTLRENLSLARAQGLHLDYHRCDITDTDQVIALAGDLPRRPTVLVHNAGVYRGARLSAYTAEEVGRTVAVKATGFANLLAAFHPDLRLLCNVSSMAAKLGGMIGQVAYAAANEALGQLGLWAAREYQLAIHTLCWNTWERTGNIVHYVGAAQYGSTIDPADGTERWIQELTALGDRAVAADQTGSGTESVYFGRFGVVAQPGWLATVAWPPEHPDAHRLKGLAVMAGTVRDFSAHRHINLSHGFDADREPVAGQVTLSLPLLLEYLLGAGDWVQPEGRPRLHLLEISDLWCDPALLNLRSGGDLTLAFDLTGEWEQRRDQPGECWKLLGTVTSGDGHEVLTGTLRYADSPPRLNPYPAEPALPVRPHHDADLWDSDQPPRLCLPHPALDALFAAAHPGSAVPGTWHIGRIAVRPGCLDADRLLTAGGDGGSFALAAGEDIVLLAEDIRWQPRRLDEEVGP